MSAKGIESGEAMGTPTISFAAEPAPKPQSLTLWELEEQLVALMHAREDPDISDEDRAGVEEALAVYVHKEIRKVDRIREYLRMCELGAQAAKEEAARHHQWAKMWEQRKEWLKASCKAAMEAFGAKRLDGRSGYLLLKKNGGLQGLTIVNPDLLPDEYCDYRLTLSAGQMVLVRQLLEDHGWDSFEPALQKVERLPNSNRIRAALERPCMNCIGVGQVQQPHHTELSPQGATVECPKCNGTGKFLVPGARLEERGAHVEVK